jgi:hypothetical protein
MELGFPFSSLAHLHKERAHASIERRKVPVHTAYTRAYTSHICTHIERRKVPIHTCIHITQMCTYRTSQGACPYSIHMCIHMTYMYTCTHTACTRAYTDLIWSHMPHQIYPGAHAQGQACTYGFRHRSRRRDVKAPQVMHAYAYCYFWMRV